MFEVEGRRFVRDFIQELNFYFCYRKFLEILS